MAVPTTWRAGGKQLATPDQAARARRHVAHLTAAGLTLSEIARRAGVAKSTLSVLVRDARAPMSRPVALKLLAARV
jgi:lambda repressor-like predicted transcriptional regulator